MALTKRGRRAAIGVGVFALLGLIAAIAEDEDPPTEAQGVIKPVPDVASATTAGGATTTTTPPTTVAPFLSERSQASVEGVAIPLEAKWAPGVVADDPNDPTSRNYHLPRGISLEQAHHWFEERIPHGEDLNERWAWCDYPEFEFGLYKWVWGKIGDPVKDSLSLTLGQEDSPNAKPEDRGTVYFFVHVFRDDDPVHC
jgi:hypothetical protein